MALFGNKKNDTDSPTQSPTGPDLTSVTGEYEIDPAHTTIGFVARHAMVTNVKGQFREFTGTLNLDGNAPEKSSASLDIKSASIDTGNADRDNHLRTADFFKIEEFPDLTFRSTGVTALGGADFQVTGDLTILGVTRPVTIDVEFNGAAKDPFGNERVGFEGRGEILRSEWGLTWNAALETGGFLVSDKIKLNFDVSAVKKS